MNDMDLVGVRERSNGMMMMLGICRPSIGEEDGGLEDGGEVGKERVDHRDLGSNVECNRESNKLKHVESKFTIASTKARDLICVKLSDKIGEIEMSRIFLRLNLQAS
jgi:hypothetical protein